MILLPKEYAVDDHGEDRVLPFGSALTPAASRESFVRVAAKASIQKLVEGDEDFPAITWEQEHKGQDGKENQDGHTICSNWAAVVADAA